MAVVGSDYFIAGSHFVGLPKIGIVEMSTLDPGANALELLKRPATGWVMQTPAGIVRAFYIDPSAKTNGDGSLSRPFNSWYSVTWSAGTAYLQKAGTVATTAVSVTGSGTSAAPIMIGAYGTGTQPVIQSSVVFDHAHYVALTGFTITSPYGAVILQNGSSHVEVAGNTLTNSGMGINITASAGGSNLIEGNDIFGNTWFGIGASVNNVKGSETIIAANSIHDNNAHGVELNGNYYIVENNYIAGNGLTVTGSSGIHTFASGATQNAGNYNLIRYNFVAGNHDKKNQDGNGIELDQYTSHNQVLSNFTYGNDGAGIALYDAFANTIQNNTLLNDEQDSGKTHLLKGELVLAGRVRLTGANAMSNNTMMANSKGVVSVFLDYNASPKTETFTNNDLVNFAGGALFFWAGVQGSDAATWHRVSGATDSIGVMPY